MWIVFSVPLMLSMAIWAHAQTAIHYTFEDGQVRGNPTAMQVPPRVLQEDGNAFMRITGSHGDKENIPDAYDPRNRSTVEFTSHGQPLITPQNQHQKYSAKMRVQSRAGVVFELFQDAAELGGYGTRDGQGPVVIFVRNGSSMWGRANYANETKSTPWNFGGIAAGSWHTYTVEAVWSHDPAHGKIVVSLDGRVISTVSGRDVNLGPTSRRLPSFKLGLYGDHAVGIVDVDDVIVMPGDGSLPDTPRDGTPPVRRLPPPRDLRIVEK